MIYARILLAGIACLCVTPTLARAQHNLLLIVADDLGVDYVGAYGEGTAPPPTPHIDALANRGVLFRNAWANPSCSPTRACILTGRYPFRTLVGRWIGHWANPQNIGLLQHSEWTIPEVLDRAGSPYSHAMVGKWHLHDSTHDPDIPRTVGGFSHFAGSLEGQIGSYTNWNRVVNGVSASTTAYCTTQNTDDALSWIQAQSGPWVCVLTYQAPHIPYHAPPAHLHTQSLPPGSPSSGHNPANRPWYKAMVESLDTEMGRLFTQLGQSVIDDTNILFIGDNGSVQQQAVAPFDPSRAKGTPYEGGINVPLIVAGPSVVSGGREVEALACSVDLFATALELCGAMSALPDYVVHDSVSLVPYLSDPAQSPLRDFAFSEQFTGTLWPSPNQNGYAIVRDERYKLIHRYSGGSHELFDLLVDPWEINNLFSGGLTQPQTQAYAGLLNHMGALRTPLAQFIPFGADTCQGSNGIPQIDSTGTPKIGTSYTIELDSAAPNRQAALLTDFQDQTLNGLPLPIDLSVIGAGAGCFLATGAAATIPRATSAAGEASVLLQLANQPWVIGMRMYHCWLVLDPSAPGNNLGVVSTRGAASLLGL